MPTPTGLTPELIKTFHTDGVVVVKNCISHDWLSQIARAIDHVIETSEPFVHGYKPANKKGQFHSKLNLWQTEPAFREFCLHSNLGQMAAAILDSHSIRLLYDQIFVKEPGTLNRTPLHNDEPYWPIQGHKALSIWFSPDPVTTDTGALEFIRGSHKWNKRVQPEKFGATSAHGDYERNPDYVSRSEIEANRNQYDFATWDLSPGDAYIFHGLTIHGASGNRSQSVRRRGYAVRYCGDDVTYFANRLGANANMTCPNHSHGDPLSEPRYPEVWGSSK